MSIWRDMTDPWPTEPPSSLPCPVCGGPVDYDARGLEEYKQLRAERDAARLELRALEWLASRGYPVGRERGGPRVMAAYREADLEPDWHPSWSSAARALGWEG